MADVVLTQRVDDAGLAGRVTVSSCGTGDWHVGQPMDERAAATLRANDYDPSAHRAQQFAPAWLAGNDLVLAMDARNLADVRRVEPDVDPERVVQSIVPATARAPRLRTPRRSAPGRRSA